MDCLIIGGGPAGLTAAIYLARFRRQCLVVDMEASRASWIPVSHNLAGFPEGIAGPDLLGALRAVKPIVMGRESSQDKVELLTRSEHGGFMAMLRNGSWQPAECVILATGAEDIPPPLDLPDRQEGVRRGLLRYCPICDAYQIRGRKIALAGVLAAAGLKRRCCCVATRLISA